MTLNILFVSITIKKNRKSKEAYLQEEQVRKLYEEHHDRSLIVRMY